MAYWSTLCLRFEGVIGLVMILKRVYRWSRVLLTFLPAKALTKQSENRIKRIELLELCDDMICIPNSEIEMAKIKLYRLSELLKIN